MREDYFAQGQTAEEKQEAGLGHIVTHEPRYSFSRRGSEEKIEDRIQWTQRGGGEKGKISNGDIFFPGQAPIHYGNDQQEQEFPAVGKAYLWIYWENGREKRKKGIADYQPEVKWKGEFLLFPEEKYEEKYDG